MGIKRVVNTDFWKDDVVAEVYSAEDRYFMLYLLTNPNTKQCGIYHLPLRNISFEMGYTQEVVRVILERFSKKYKNIIYNPDTQEIAILNFLKHSIVKGGKPVEDCIRKELEQVKDMSLISAVYQNMKPYMDKQIEISSLKQNAPDSMYIGIEKILLSFIDISTLNNKEPINDNDNDNERIVTRIVPRIVTEQIDYQSISDHYNEICVSYPRLTKLSEARKKAIKARMNTYTEEDFKTLFIMAEESEFLKGKNDRNWTANFDWLIKDSNMAKVLDGNYKTKKPQTKLDSFIEVIKEWGND